MNKKTASGLISSNITILIHPSSFSKCFDLIRRTFGPEPIPVTLDPIHENSLPMSGILSDATGKEVRPIVLRSPFRGWPRSGWPARHTPSAPSFTLTRATCPSELMYAAGGRYHVPSKCVRPRPPPYLLTWENVIWHNGHIKDAVMPFFFPSKDLDSARFVDEGKAGRFFFLCFFFFTPTHGNLVKKKSCKLFWKYHNVNLKKTNKQKNEKRHPLLS